ncbi:MAG TPA: sorbosone dehydrogenase family protein [Candidatus Limnocylindrales bacterium]|nr:sorbosone dehydrogenase family protein [Candidatus Limnocylindrales bacterium]
MRFSTTSLIAVALCVLTAAGCGDHARLPESAGFGPTPTLPPPHKSLFPTTNVVTAVGWSVGARPTAAPETTVSPFAKDLQHPRWLYVLPNGDVLVAETDGPPRPDDEKGVKKSLMHTMMKQAGSDQPSANRITLLRDAGGDGAVETRSLFLKGLNSPFGMELIGNDFYVANTDALMRYHYSPGDMSIQGPGVRIANLPGGPLNHHWTKNVIASPDHKKLYVTVGSNSNAAENGIDKEAERAAIWEIDLATGAHRIFASGLRNANGLGWEPETGALWAAVNERDELGSDLVPDYMTAVRDGAFYGWPYSYYGAHVDARVKPMRPDLVATAVVPDYALGNHTASLGLAFMQPGPLAARFGSGVFIGQHGSWNREPRAGYKVIFVPFSHGKPSGMPVDVLTGFVSADGKAFGRPVGVAIDRHGGLLVADDVGNTVWRVTANART